MREKGRGVIGMKIMGEGRFTSPEDREKSIRFAMQPGLLDCVTIGFKNTAEIDEAIQTDQHRPGGGGVKAKSVKCEV